MEGHLAVRLFLDYVKRISALNNQLELHKRRLAEAVHQIQDYIECFRGMDLDKRGKITQKVLQNWLISKKHYHKPEAISRYYSKYSREKAYLSYEDVLEALLPNADYILVSHTLTNLSEYTNRPSKFTYSCQRERIESIQHLTAFIVSQELKALDKDYAVMRNITKGSQRIGAILWRILDRNHTNSVDYQHIKMNAEQIGIQLLKHEWECFLYWHFHSYKASINRDHFMRLLDVHQQQKRATSACKIDQFKVQKELFKRAEEEKARNERIKSVVEEKLAMMPLIGKAEYLNIMREEHFPFELLNTKRELKGKKGYCNPTNLVKYVAER